MAGDSQQARPGYWLDFCADDGLVVDEIGRVLGWRDRTSRTSRQSFDADARRLVQWHERMLVHNWRAMRELP